MHRRSVRVGAGKVEVGAVSGVAGRDGGGVPGLRLHGGRGDADFRAVDGDERRTGGIGDFGAGFFPVHLQRVDIAGVDQFEKQVVAGSVFEAELEFHLDVGHSRHVGDSRGLHHSAGLVAFAGTHGEHSLVFLAAEEVAPAAEVAADHVRIGHRVGGADPLAADVRPGVGLDESGARGVEGDWGQGFCVAVAAAAVEYADFGGVRGVGFRLVSAHNVAAPDEIVEALIPYEVAVGGVVEIHSDHGPGFEGTGRYGLAGHPVVSSAYGDFQAFGGLGGGQYHGD